MLADAFVVAQRLPNHFRAIFGEGAFNAAYRAELFARARDSEGAAQAKHLLGADCSRCCWRSQLVLLALALLFMPQLVALLAPGFCRRSGEVRAAR